MKYRKCDRIPGVVLGALTALLLPVPAFAQQAEDLNRDRWDIEFRGGTALPAGIFTDYAETGGRLGGGVGLWLTDHVAIRADGNYDFFNGEEATTTIIEMPTMGIAHFALGVELDVISPMSDTRWNLTTHAGVGPSTFDTDTFRDPEFGTTTDITTTGVGVNAGIEVGYDVTENVMVSLGTNGYAVFLDEGETSKLDTLNPENDALENVYAFPLLAAVEIDLR